MKKTILSLALLAGFSTVSYAQEVEFNYVSEFATQGTPLAIAADPNGGIYFTIFSFGGPNQSRCYYVADPVNANGVENHVLVDDAGETEEPAGRGFAGIAVDGTGNVFLTLESGGNDTATVRKLSPAPNFTPVDDFFGGVVYGGKRYNGIDIVNDETIVLSTFDRIEFWNAVDSEPLFEVTGGETYQRDVAYNPNNGDIYIAKNRLVNAEPISSANVLRGNASDLATYTTIEPNFIAQGGAGGQFGVNAQLIEYDLTNDLIITPHYSADGNTMVFYTPSDTSTPVLALDGSESPNGPMTTPTDSVAMRMDTGHTWLFITDHGTSRILIYSTQEQTEIRGWELY